MSAIGVNYLPDAAKRMTLPVQKQKGLGPEHLAWYWHPFRASVKFAPASFRARLQQEMGDELDVTWNPMIERWQVWMRAPAMKNPICWGWKLLFIHNGPSGEYLPLDERIFARLYSASAAKWGSGKRYMDAILREMERADAQREQRLTQEAIDQAMPYYDYSQIKVSGCGKSRGDKFATYFA